MFAELVPEEIPPASSVDEEVDLFTESVVQAARESIPMSSTHPRRVPVPWWNEECASAVREKKRHLRIVQRHPTEENMISFMRAKARAKRIMKESKKEAWRRYVPTVTVSTPAAKVWEKVRKISGCNTSPAINGLLVNGSVVTHPVEIANTLASTFASISSSTNYPHEFQTRKEGLERFPLLFDSPNTEEYNRPLTRGELDSALSECKDSSPGPDAIHYQMIRHLPEISKIRLLEMFNSCGFRRHRSTVDHLVKLETAIRDAFISKQHLVAVFFDIEKAYDTTWRFEILRTLYSWGLRGRMIRFISDFMSDRSFRVRIGNNVSRSFALENAR